MSTLSAVPHPSSEAEAAAPGMEAPPAKKYRKRNRQRRTPCPPCPALPRFLTGNRVERTIMARVQRGGRRYQRNFSLGHHGSWEAAAEAAADWLRVFLAKLPLISNTEMRPGKRNRSGVVGVFYRAGKHTTRAGLTCEYPSYVTRWPGARAGVRWMFSTHEGEENAFVLACLCRKLATTDRAAVAQAYGELSPADRAQLLALRRPVPTPKANPALLGARETTAEAAADAFLV